MVISILPEKVEGEPTMRSNVRILLWAHNLGALALALAFSSLTGFHMYLLYRQMGTYDWLLDSNKNTRTEAQTSKAYQNSSPVVPEDGTSTTDDLTKGLTKSPSFSRKTSNVTIKVSDAIDG